MKVNWHDAHAGGMHVNKSKEVVYLTYPQLEQLPEFIHGFQYAAGWCEPGIYASMNLSFTRGDDESRVFENYRRLGEAMGFAAEDVVTSDQTHTTNVRVMKEQDRGNGITKPRPYTDVDGMVTDVPGLVLATFCGLRTSVFCGPGASSHRTVPFRLERYRGKDRRRNCGNDEM